MIDTNCSISRIKQVALGLGLLLAGWQAGWAQSYMISTVAGGAPPPTPMRALDASIGSVFGVATDREGALYFSASLHCVFKLDPAGSLTRIAGNCRSGYSGDGDSAGNAQLSTPKGVAVDAAHNVYIVDEGNYRIRKVSPGGVISTIAGNGTEGYTGDGGQATDALLFAAAIAVDSTGNLYISDPRHGRIRKISSDGIIGAFAGTGFADFSGDGGPATKAALNFPAAMAIDANDNLYVADQGNNRVRKISPDGIISTVAGNGEFGSSGDGGPATSASVVFPAGVATDSAGNVYILDGNRVRKVDTEGIINTVAGGDTPGGSGDGGPATSATLSSPTAIAVDFAGNLNIAEAGSHRIRRVSSDGVIRTVAGDGVNSYSGDGGSAIRAQLSGPFAVAADSGGNFYVADTANNRIRKVTADGAITSVAGDGTEGYSGDGGAATSAQLNSVVGLAVDSAGALYFAEYYNSSVRKVSPEGVITTIAGGRAGYSGDGGPATSAALNGPVGVAIDGIGAVYVADQQNFRVRKITPDGTITTVVGNGTRGFSGDGGPATSAQLDVSFQIAVDAAGNLYIADASNRRVRKVSPDGIIRTVAGNGAFGLAGDGGPAIESELYAPQGVAADSAGNIYIADGNRIRKVGTNGIISTIAGTTTSGYSGDGGPATNAQLGVAVGVAVDPTGKVYVADRADNSIRLLQPIQ